MSVYKHGRFWHYDFVLKGRRYFGSTGQTTKRAAEAVERTRRLEAATGSGPDAGDWTLDEACGRYWDEVAQFKRTAKDLKRQLFVVMACIGKHTRLRDIDALRILEGIAKRRTMDLKPRAKSKRRKKNMGHNLPPRVPAPATINRDMIDCTLRPILRRAHRTWGAKGLPGINWGDLRQREPKGLVQEYTDAQVDAWRGELEPLPRFWLDMLFTYGLRYGELFHSPEAVDGVGARLTLEGRYRKNGDILKQPLRKDHARILAAMATQARAEERDVVNTFSYWQLASLLRAAAARAGIPSFRVIHGVRHHAATRILRKTKNLKLTKDYMGHASITSTIRYAHTHEDDIREAIDQMSRHSPDEESLLSENLKASGG